MSLVDPAKEALALQVRYEAQFQGTKRLEMVTVIASDAPSGELDALLDKMARAADRQSDYYELEAMRQKLKDLQDLIRRYEGDAIRVLEVSQAQWAASGRRGDWTEDCLSGSEKQARLAVEKSIAKARQEGTQLKLEIAKMEARVGTRTPDVRADREPGDSDRQDPGDGAAGWPAV